MPKKHPIPTSISPMFCQLTRNVTDDPAYVHEVKWDGYRIIAYIEKGKVRMTSRGGNDYTSRYPAIEKALQQLGHDLVIDGEMVVFDEKGMPAFHEMQSSKVTAPGLGYCAFDLLWIDGVNMMDKPLVERKKRLEKLLGKNPIIKYSPHFEDGPGLYAQMEGMGMEGVVSKKRDSAYRPGDRGGDWKKTPTHLVQEFVIGGYLESANLKSFSSLQLGAYDNGKFIWVTRSGGGYTEKLKAEIMGVLKKHTTKVSPFTNLREARGKYIVKINGEDKVLENEGRKIHWIKPIPVARFKFATWQASGQTRKPVIWAGWREDKKAIDVKVERPA